MLLKTLKPMTLILIGAIVAIIGGLISAYGTYSHNKKSSEKSDKIYQQLENQAKTIDELRRENTNLYSKLTGGDSYCKIEVTFNATTNKPSFRLMHIGDSPLQNFNISIEDYGRRGYFMKQMSKSELNSPLLSQIVEKTRYSFHFASLQPSTATEINIPVEQNQTDINLKIFFYLNNGEIVETLNVQNINTDKRIFKIEIKRGDKVLESR